MNLLGKGSGEFHEGHLDNVEENVIKSVAIYGGVE